MAFEAGIVSEDWMNIVIILLYKGKWERTQCKSCRGIGFLRVVKNIYTGLVRDRIGRVIEGLTDDDQDV